MRILIIDDDKELCEGIIRYLHLRDTRIDADYVLDSAGALAYLEENTPDLIVLDVLLPDESGFYLCGKIKEKIDIPIIFLSNFGEEENRVRGFLSGGDDYVVKPFSLEELTLRISARIRSTGNAGAGTNDAGFSGEADQNDRQCFQFGRIRIIGRYLVGTEQENEGGQPDGHGRKSMLTDKERDILVLLAKNEGRVFTFSEIYSYVWHEPDNNDIRPVQSHVHNLRKKLESVYGKKDCIRTRWGKGYVFHRP